jgi:hypothetical protein
MIADYRTLAPIVRPDGNNQQPYRRPPKGAWSFALDGP